MDTTHCRDVEKELGASNSPFHLTTRNIISILNVSASVECHSAAIPSYSPKVLRTYGRLQIDFPPKARTALLNKMWSELEKAGVEYTATHYATLLTVLAENGQGDFSPEVTTTLNAISESKETSME